MQLTTTIEGFTRQYVRRRKGKKRKEKQEKKQEIKSVSPFFYRSFTPAKVGPTYISYCRQRQWQVQYEETTRLKKMIRLRDMDI